MVRSLGHQQGEREPPAHFGRIRLDREAAFVGPDCFPNFSPDELRPGQRNRAIRPEAKGFRGASHRFVEPSQQEGVARRVSPRPLHEPGISPNRSRESFCFPSLSLFSSVYRLSEIAAKKGVATRHAPSEGRTDEPLGGHVEKGCGRRRSPESRKVLSVTSVDFAPRRRNLRLCLRLTQSYRVLRLRVEVPAENSRLLRVDGAVRVQGTVPGHHLEVSDPLQKKGTILIPRPPSVVFGWASFPSSRSGGFLRICP